MKKASISILLFTLFIFLAFNKHSKDDYSSYRSVLWADASGYHIYNPIWFIYGNDFSQMPDSINYRTGTGFSFDESSGRVVTKYTSGVAILQAPFFLVAHFLSGPLGFDPDGFSPVYHGAIMIAGAFYGLFGLFFCFYFLRRFFTERISFITVAIFFLASNLYYYTLDASGFLHVYAFFLISIVAYYTSKIYESLSLRTILPLTLALALVILIRPTNMLLIPFVLLFGLSGRFSERINLLKDNIKIILASIFIAGILFIPQLIYWSQSYGSPIVYSYGEEGFSNYLSPKLLSVWFSTNNGLFTWAPVLLISIIGMVLSVVRKNNNGILVGIIFLFASYLFASWWNYWFGCAMGARSFVEYYPLLMFPFAFALSKLKNKIAIALISAFMLVCVFINFNIIYYYDGCFYGGEWDWNTFFNLITD